MKIRTREKCPKCKGKFIELEWTFICPSCLTRPKRYYIEYCYQGKPKKIYKDYLRRTLANYEQSEREMERVKLAIKTGEFDLNDHQHGRDSSYQFKAYANRWLKKYTKLYDLGRIAPTTLKSVNRYVNNYFIPHFQNTDIRNIKNGEIEDFYLALPSELAQSSHRSLMSYLHKFFVDALNREDIKKMPCFPTVSVDDIPITVLCDDLIEKIIDCIPEKHQNIFIFLWKQGARPGEARALQIEDVDLINKTVTICRTFSGDIYHKKTKNKKIRKIPLLPKTYQHLTSSIDSRNEGFVFLGPKGTPYPNRTLTYIWKEALKKCSVPDVRLYTLRHSFATNALTSGAPKELILKFIGTTVETYLHENMAGHIKVLNCICPDGKNKNTIYN